MVKVEKKREEMPRCDRAIVGLRCSLLRKKTSISIIC